MEPKLGEPTPQDWKQFVGLLRVLGALLVLLAAAAYGGRLLERIETLGNEIKGLAAAVNEVKLITADVKALTVTVQTLVENQRALAATDSELRRQLDDLRGELRAEELRRDPVRR
jgi:hypothetical protein